MSPDRILTVRQPLPYLAGVIVGDGWLTARTLGLRVADDDFAYTFAAAVEAAFGVRREPRLDERGYWLYRTANSRGKFDSLRCVSLANDEAIAAWLRGLFDSEGNAQFTLTKRGGHCYTRRVAYYSTSVETLGLAAERLAILGVLTSRYSVKPSKGHKGTKPVYELAVRGGRRSYELFNDLVGSSIKRKRDALHLIATKYDPDGHRRAQLRGVEVRNARKAAGGRY